MAKWGQILEAPFNMIGDVVFNFGTLKPENGWPDIGQGGGGGGAATNMTVGNSSAVFYGYNSGTPYGAVDPNIIDGQTIEWIYGEISAISNFVRIRFVGAAQIGPGGNAPVDVTFGTYGTVTMAWGSAGGSGQYSVQDPALRDWIISQDGNTIQVTFNI